MGLSIGELRRYECSLTKEERREIEIKILKDSMKGSSTSVAPIHEGIKRSLILRGYLRCGMSVNSRNTEYRETVKTTERGKSALGLR